MTTQWLDKVQREFEKGLAWLEEQGVDFLALCYYLEVEWLDAMKLHRFRTISANPELYAKLYYHLGVRSADPRKIPPRKTGHGMVVRAWTNEQYSVWRSQQTKLPLRELSDEQLLLLSTFTSHLELAEPIVLVNEQLLEMASATPQQRQHFLKTHEKDLFELQRVLSVFMMPATQREPALKLLTTSKRKG